jgi:hypothetical protein
MMFNLKRFVKFTRTALFRAGGTHYRLTPKRIAWLLAFYPVFALLEIATWTCLQLDRLLYPGFLRQEIREPVFIIGNPRSGTTFLHRLLARDVHNMSSMVTWEILFAPSIVQRKVGLALSAVDRSLGSPLRKLIVAMERRLYESLLTHRFSLLEPEEDEYIFVHTWSTLVTSTTSAIMVDADAYTRFDKVLPRWEKRRIMRFYRRCLQRHLYAHRADQHAGRHYLAKSPPSTPKIDTFYRWFPDARFIYLVRSPLQVIPSYLNLVDAQWRTMADPLTPWAARDWVIDMAKHWYTYPLEWLDRAPPESHFIVRYDDLVADPEATVRRIYDRLGLRLSPAYSEVLEQEAERARSYRSRHHYDIEEMGISREEIVETFREVFDRFGFEAEERTWQD